MLCAQHPAPKKSSYPTVPTALPMGTADCADQELIERPVGLLIVEVLSVLPLLPCNACEVRRTLQYFIRKVGFPLLDPLGKLGGVVAHRVFERNFEFEQNRNLLAFFLFLGLG